MSIASDHSLKDAGARGWAGRALSWWLGELRGFYGEAVRRLEAASRSMVVIEAGERYWILRQGRRAIGQVDWHHQDAASGADTLRQLIPAGRRGRPVLVEVPPERVLSKVVHLPAGAQRELDRILEFEFPRHFPFPAERVLFRHRLLGRREAVGSGAAALAVEIVAVPRETIDEIAEALSAAGLRASGIAMIAAGDAPPLFLAPEALTSAPARARSSRVLAVGVGLLAVGAAASWPGAQQMRLAAIDQELAALKPGAEAVLKTREQQRREIDRSAAVLRLRGARPPLVTVLDALTREIPDGSWLLSFSVAGRDVVIEGLSPSAATIAMALEHSPNFTDIVFRSPITREPGSGLEHFQLGATIPPAKRP